jgi:dihydropyrimidine dehydrogenase (NAD+) subunit PreA
MCERGMGSAVGQEPALNERITSWAKEYSTVPVLVKLTPNVDDIGPHGLAAKQAAAPHGVSLINTIKSIIGVDLERKVPSPRRQHVDQRRLLRAGGQADRPAHGRQPGPRRGLQAADQRHRRGLELARRGGVYAARLLVGAGVHGGHAARLPRGRGHDRGPRRYMRDQGFANLDERCAAQAVPSYSEWGELDLNYETSPEDRREQVHRLPRCVVACHDGAHQCIHPDTPTATRVPIVDESECVGCNLCQIVCPVPGASRWSRCPTGCGRRPGICMSMRGRSCGPRRAFTDVGAVRMI